MADNDATAFAHEQMPFAKLLGVEVVQANADIVELRARWAPEHCTTNGMLHGGYLMSVADTAGAMCAFYNLPEGASGTSTIESKTNFVGSVQAGSVTATSTPVHAGRTTVLVQTDITDDNGRLVTRSLQTQVVLYPR